MKRGALSLLVICSILLIICVVEYYSNTDPSSRYNPLTGKTEAQSQKSAQKPVQKIGVEGVGHLPNGHILKSRCALEVQRLILKEKNFDWAAKAVTAAFAYYSAIGYVHNLDPEEEANKLRKNLESENTRTYCFYMTALDALNLK